MKTADKAKVAGLNSLAEMAQLENRCTQTLRNWDKNNPIAFDAALKRAVKAKEIL